MSKKLQTLIAVICFAPILFLIGCSGFQDILTPCHIDEEVLEYTNDTGRSYMPYTSLFDAKRILHKLDYVHIQVQMACERMKQDDNLKHDYMTQTQNYHVESAEQFKGIVFDPSGPLGFLAVAGLGTAGGALLIKRPGDKSKKQIEEENGKNKI